MDANRDFGPDAVTLPYLRVANVQDGHLNLDTITEITVPRVTALASTLRRGDVLMTEGGDLDKLGRGTVWNSEIINCLHQNHVFAVRPDQRRLLPEYLSLVTQTAYARAYFESTGTKTTNLASTSSSKIRDFRIPLPSLDEQRRIANFLDAETARIDELVRLRNLQVDLLAEALRDEAVRIRSAGWQLLPLRRIVNSVQTGTTPVEILLPADSENVPWYTPAALGGTLDLSDADKSVSKGDFHTVPRFSANSILIVGIGESLGKVADLDHEATGNQQLTAIIVSSSADRRFVLWRLFAAYDEIRAWAQYSRVRILNNEALKSFPIPVPALDEQIRIREDLDRRLAEFIGFRDAAARFSQLAGERRQALITAAVTGGITV